MSTKKSKKSGTNKKKDTASAGAANKPARSRLSAVVSEVEATPGTDEAREPDQRIPAAGTVIQKLDRHKKVRCECTVVEDGFLYHRKTYPSLSAAAMAAATDLGLKNKTQNGFTFWGLSKPPRPPSDPVEVVALGSDRFLTRVGAAVKDDVDDENRAKVKAALLKHQQKVETLLEGIG